MDRSHPTGFKVPGNGLMDLVNEIVGEAEEVEVRVGEGRCISMAEVGGVAVFVQVVHFNLRDSRGYRGASRKYSIPRRGIV